LIAAKCGASQMIGKTAKAQAHPVLRVIHAGHAKTRGHDDFSSQKNLQSSNDWHT
jgi:hypothetical protein